MASEPGNLPNYFAPKLITQLSSAVFVKTIDARASLLSSSKSSRSYRCTRILCNFIYRAKRSVNCFTCVKKFVVIYKYKQQWVRRVHSVNEVYRGGLKSCSRSNIHGARARSPHAHVLSFLLSYRTLAATTIHLTPPQSRTNFFSVCTNNSRQYFSFVFAGQWKSLL